MVPVRTRSSVAFLQFLKCLIISYKKLSTSLHINQNGKYCRHAGQTHTATDKLTNRQPYKQNQTDRHTDRQTDGHTDTHTQTHTQTQTWLRSWSSGVRAKVPAFLRWFTSRHHTCQYRCNSWCDIPSYHIAPHVTLIYSFLTLFIGIQRSNSSMLSNSFQIKIQLNYQL